MQTQRIASLIYTLDQETDVLSNIQVVPEPDNLESLGVFGTHDRPLICCTHLHVNKGLATGVMCKGEMIVQGGTADFVTVEQGGSLLALSGKILHVRELGGNIDTGAYEGEITFEPVKWSATGLDTVASVHHGNVCFNTTILNDYGMLDIYDGGKAHDLEVYGFLNVFGGGYAFNVNLHGRSDSTVENGGCIQHAVVEENAWLRLMDGAKALDIIVKPGGHLIVKEGAETDRITVEGGGHMERE